MDFETLIKETSYAGHVPDEIVNALLPHAERLGPQIETLARRRLKGEWLFPSEDSLLFYGIFVLAAAHERRFWPIWIDMLSAPSDLLGNLFGDGVTMSVRAITLGLIETDVETVAQLAASSEISSDARAGLVDVLARLMCEGRYPREQLVELIDHLAVIEGTDDDDRCRWCAQEAIVLGGISERTELLEQLWQTDAFYMWNDADRREELELLATAIANLADLTRFDEDGITAPQMPADGLRWLRSIERHNPDTGDFGGLSWRERESFAFTLKRIGSRGGAMSFEELDGFFHALVICPEVILPSEYLSHVWGSAPVFESDAQVQDALGLIQRHWNAIAGRVNARAEPVMWLESFGDDRPGARWASGFARGVDLHPNAWDRIGEDAGAAIALDGILCLEDGELDPAERIENLETLPQFFTDLVKFWQKRKLRSAPARSRKIGRNEPCPCGSGKKWKKCCGAGPAPILH